MQDTGRILAGFKHNISKYEETDSKSMEKGVIRRFGQGPVWGRFGEVLGAARRNLRSRLSLLLALMCFPTSHLSHSLSPQGAGRIDARRAVPGQPRFWKAQSNERRKHQESEIIGKYEFWRQIENLKKSLFLRFQAL